MAKFAKTSVESMTDTVQGAAQDAVAQMDSAMKTFTEKFEMPEAVRDAALRMTGVAKERFADAHLNANNATVTFEKAMSDYVNAGASAARAMMQASHDNAVATFAAIEKIVAAKSATEAFQIQSEFARDFASANWARVQTAAETVKAKVEDGVKMFQDEAAKVVAFTKKAA